VRGVENLDEIAAVPGIHGLMFGPGDYMISAGLPLKLGGEPHPKFVAAMTKLITAAKTNGLALFGYVFSSSRRGTTLTSTQRCADTRDGPCVRPAGIPVYCGGIRLLGSGQLR
jgi:citrate lyase beta subunit